MAHGPPPRENVCNSGLQLDARYDSAGLKTFYTLTIDQPTQTLTVTKTSNLAVQNYMQFFSFVCIQWKETVTTKWLGVNYLTKKKSVWDAGPYLGWPLDGSG